MEFSILGGEVYPISITFFREKKCFFHKKYKDDQNGLIHPEFEDFNFSLLGGQGSQTLNFNCLVLNILKEADIDFFFKVLAKFGDNKHNKDIKQIVGNKCFFLHKNRKNPIHLYLV